MNRFKGISLRKIIPVILLSIFITMILFYLHLHGVWVHGTLLKEMDAGFTIGFIINFDKKAFFMVESFLISIFHNLKWLKSNFLFQGSILMLIVSGALSCVLVVIFFHLRYRRKMRRFLEELGYHFQASFTTKHYEVDLFSEYPSSLGAEILELYNRMADRIQTFVDQLKESLMQCRKQRDKFRRWQALYKRYLPPSLQKRLIGSKLRGKDLTRERIKVVSLFIELVDFFNQLDGVYPGVIAKELEAFHLFLHQQISDNGGYLNFIGGNRLNIVFGMIDKNPQPLKKTIDMLKRIEGWVEKRNRRNNLSGVPWKITSGIAEGDAVVAMLGFQVIAMGPVLEQSMQMCSYGKEYGVVCVAPEEIVQDEDLMYGARILDLVDDRNRKKFRIVELFTSPLTNERDNGVKLYEHGLAMMEEENYEMAISNFKKAHQLLGDDVPSEIMIQRCMQLKDGDS